MRKMSEEKILLRAKYIELSEESNDIYMVLNMCILTNKANFNGAEFTDNFINGVVTNKETYIGIPLVVNKHKLEKGLYKSLTHELDKKTGQLKTQVIGSFIDFWSEEDEDGSLKLMGSVRVLKRYPKVCEAILELYNDDDLEMSCEVLVAGYEKQENGIRYIAYKYGKKINHLIGSAVVSEPAEVKSKATLLIAEAFNYDFEGGAHLSKEQTEVFNKGKDINYHTGVETSSLKWSEVSGQIYNILNPVNLKTTYRKYNYYIRDLYHDYVLVEEYDDSSTLWRIDYEIVNDSVVLSNKDTWVKGKLGFIPDGIEIASLIEKNKNLENELDTKITEINNKHKEDQNLTEQEIKELQNKVTELSDKVTELNQTIVNQQETIKTHEQKETELANQVRELTPYKDKLEKAEKETKKNALVEKYSVLLSEEVMQSETVVAALENLDEQALNTAVVEQVSKEMASKEPKEKPVVVAASKQGELIKSSVLEKYGIN